MSARDIATRWGEMLTVRRKDLGLTQEDLAALAGVSPRTVVAIENGKATSRFDMLVAVADVLGLDLVLAPRTRSDH